jgi:hypothetical protein
LVIRVTLTQRGVGELLEASYEKRCVSVKDAMRASPQFFRITRCDRTMQDGASGAPIHPPPPPP